jgi:hypothetical protein
VVTQKYDHHAIQITSAVKDAGTLVRGRADAIPGSVGGRVNLSLGPGIRGWRRYKWGRKPELTRGPELVAAGGGAPVERDWAWFVHLHIELFDYSVRILRVHEGWFGWSGDVGRCMG